MTARRISHPHRQRWRHASISPEAGHRAERVQEINCTFSGKAGGRRLSYCLNIFSEVPTGRPHTQAAQDSRKGRPGWGPLLSVASHPTARSLHFKKLNIIWRLQRKSLWTQGPQPGALELLSAFGALGTARPQVGQRLIHAFTSQAQNRNRGFKRSDWPPTGPPSLVPEAGVGGVTTNSEVPEKGRL